MVNTNKIKEMLMQAIFETMEKMFFVFAEPVPEPSSGMQIMANIGYTGPLEGEMQISMSEDLARIMSMNMLSLDDNEVTDSVIADCVKECLNMVCGSFMRKVDPDRVFHLAIPSFTRLSGHVSDANAQTDAPFRLFFDTEGGAFEVMLTATDSIEKNGN